MTETIRTNTVTDHTITSLDQLTSLYRQPTDVVKAKKAQRLDEVTARTIRSSPFFLLATADASGRCDVSPRGGPPGQLVVLDDRRIVFPDLNGNNLVDSLRNIIANPHAGLLVITPGTDETLRIEGSASLTVDPDLIGRWEGLLRRPKVAVVITIDDVFIHCAKAFRRAELWNPDSWTRFRELPDPMEMLLAHTGVEAEPAQIRSDIEGRYAEQLAQDRPET